MTQNTLFGGILQLVGVQNFKFSGYMTVSGLCMHDFGKFWKILENFLLSTEIPTDKMLQRQIYARIRKHTVPNHIWCHIHAKFRGLKSHLITSESHPRVTSGQNSEASHIRVSHPQSHPDKIQSLPGGHPIPMPVICTGLAENAYRVEVNVE